MTNGIECGFVTKPLVCCDCGGFTHLFVGSCSFVAVLSILSGLTGQVVVDDGTVTEVQMRVAKGEGVIASPRDLWRKTG